VLLADLADFVTRHWPCGQLTGDATEPEPSGYVLTVTYAYGAVFTRLVTLDEASRDLVVSDLLITTN